MIRKKKIAFILFLPVLFLILAKQNFLIASQATINFRPFQAYRPTNDLIPSFTCPPYNSINSIHAYQFACSHKDNFIHVIRPTINLPTESDLYDNMAAHAGKAYLETLIKKETLKRDTKPAYYLYGQQKDETTLFGIIGELALDNYQHDLVMPHEKIISAKKKAVTTFTKIQQAQIDPIVLAYKSNPIINKIIEQTARQKPTQQCLTEDNITHYLWVIDNQETIIKLEEAFTTISKLYIADGHHRSASAKKLFKQEPTNLFYHHILAALFSDTSITILAYNRLLKSLAGLSSYAFLNIIKKSFYLKPVASAAQAEPLKAHDFGMLLDGSWYTLSLHKKFITMRQNNPVESLDITILNELLLQPFFQVRKLVIDQDIEFIGGLKNTKELEEAYRQGGWHVAFALYPVSLQQLMDVVDAGQLMPAKATWFEPKIRPGFIVRCAN